MDRQKEKNRNHLRRKRSIVRKRPVGVVSAFILGSGSAGAPKCVYLHTDHDRYLFNAGEGTQRLAQELKLKLRKVKAIFITSESWDKVSGMYGIAMAQRVIGVTDVNIYGPSNLHYLFDESSSFVRLDNMSLTGHACEVGGSFEDEAITVLFAPITSPSNDERAVCYVVVPKDRRPKLDPERCRQLNVPKGPMYGILKGGGEVIVDGKVIRSSDVTDPADQPLVLLLIDAPSEDFIPALQESALISEHGQQCSIVIHFTPLAVMHSPAYMRWMSEKLGSTTAHVLVNEAAAYGSGGTSSRQQMFLHELVPDAFPLLQVPSILQIEKAGDRRSSESRARSSSGFDNVIPPPAPHETWRDSFHGIQNLVAAEPLLEYRLKPPSRFNVLRCPVFDLAQESSKIREKIEQVRHLVQNLQSHVRESRSKNLYPSLLFTGTGGAVPSPLRNTAGILVNFSESQSILLDCAEGTVGQLIRLLGPQETSRVLSTICAIFISHPHADHTLGLPSLLEARSEAGHSSSQLNLIAPEETNDWLSSCETRGFLRANTCTKFNSSQMYGSSSLSRLLGVSESEMSRMVHCWDAYGIAMETYEGKVTYSGDSIPVDELVRIGANSDILINEATMGTTLPRHARRKKHCTTQDALDLADRMRARNTVLTHFSTRYARIPQLLDLNKAQNTIIAFDNMWVRPTLMSALSNMIKPLSEIYQEKLQRIRRREIKQR